MRALVVVIAILVASIEARAEPRCVGWAVPGVLVGEILAGTATYGTMKLVGVDTTTPAHETGVTVSLVVSFAVGGSLGPIATCRAFAHEPHAVPAASFVVAGGWLGGIAAGSAFVGAAGNRCSGPEATTCIYYVALVGAAGAIAGGYGGYYLHRSVFRERATIAPIVAPGAAGLAVSGRF
jgi:hypothetical protein